MGYIFYIFICIYSDLAYFVVTAKQFSISYTFEKQSHFP